MSANVLKYRIDQGLIRIEITITGTETWSYTYVEDQTHSNSNNLHKPLKHTIGEPHELVKSYHHWYFNLINPADVDILVDVEIKWFQLINSLDENIYRWNRNNTKIKAGEAESISDNIILYAIKTS